MGFVWQAHDQVLDREVAVKEVFVPDQDEGRDRRAFREARAAARLNHPGIVTIHDLVSAEGRSWIVMELVDAPSLEDVLRESGPLAPERVARIGLAMLEALRAAHDAGILHRDIKPGNVLLPGERAVITDFGIATIQGDSKLTATGQVIGTPAYMAPERIRGEPASEASDMWELGATLYAAVMGHPLGAGAVIDAGPLTPVLEGLLRGDPGARLTAEQASALIARRPASLPASTGPGPTRLNVGADTQPPADAQAYELTAAPPASIVAAGPPDMPDPGRGTSAGRWRRMPSRLVAAAAGLAAVVIAVVLTVTLSGGPQASHGQAQTASTASGRHTATASPSSASIPAPAIGPSGYPAASPEIPAGYSVYTDLAQHFSAAIPDSWLATTDNGGRRFCAPGGCPEVIFVQQITGGSDPIVDIRNTSAANGNFPAPDYINYHQLRIGEVAYYAQAAEVEFTIHKRGTPGDLHGLARIFTITNGGEEYYVQMTALSASWHNSLSIFGVFFATFRPNTTDLSRSGSRNAATWCFVLVWRRGGTPDRR
jgi:serine/threonine protein kinase